MMDALFSNETKEALMSAHVVVGWGLLLSGAIAVTTRKGERLHRLAGTVFFSLMILTVVLSVLLELNVRRLQWTFVLAGSAASCLFCGYVAARLRNRWPGALGALGILFTVILGTAFLFTPGLHHSPLRPMTLGVGMLALASFDIATWRRREVRYWWFVHLRHMLASFSLALVAFSGATLKSLPVWAWKWWPIFLGFFAIVAFSLHYNKKLRSSASEAGQQETPETSI